MLLAATKAKRARVAAVNDGGQDAAVHLSHTDSDAGAHFMQNISVDFIFYLSFGFCDIL